jgi:hypothetical protein
MSMNNEQHFLTTHLSKPVCVKPLAPPPSLRISAGKGEAKRKGKARRAGPSLGRHLQVVLPLRCLSFKVVTCCCALQGCPLPPTSLPTFLRCAHFLTVKVFLGFGFLASQLPSCNPTATLHSSSLASHCPGVGKALAKPTSKLVPPLYGS